jgi:hypothetical protein
VTEFANHLVPVAGVYERLITDHLQEQIDLLDQAGWKAIDAHVGSESSPHVIARHVGEA